MNVWPNFKSTLRQNFLFFFLFTFPRSQAQQLNPVQYANPHPHFFHYPFSFHFSFFTLSPSPSISLPTVTPSCLLLLIVSPFTISSILHLSDRPLCFVTQSPQVTTTHAKCLGCRLMHTDSHGWNVTGLSTCIPPLSQWRRARKIELRGSTLCCACQVLGLLPPGIFMQMMMY